MNTGFSKNPAFSFGAPKVTSCCIPQLSFPFYRHRAIRADFSGGQITTDAGLLPLRAFDQRHGLTGSLAECLRDPRTEERVQHSVLSLFRQRLYQIIAGYEDVNDAREPASYDKTGQVRFTFSFQFLFAFGRNSSQFA
jgi:hypothetical protein